MKSIKKQYEHNTPKKFEDNKGKLKYLFWINIDALIEDIKNSKEYKIFEKEMYPKSDTIEKLFNVIFDKIFEYCHDYTSFLNITAENAYMFFDHQQLQPLDSPLKTALNWNYNDNIYALFKEALKNHLIIHHFLSSVNEANDHSYPLTAKYETELTVSLSKETVKSNNKISDFRINYTQDPYNFFSRRKKRYDKDVFNKLYSHKILNDICEPNTVPFKVSSALKTWAYYCYAAKSVLNFDRTILSQNISQNIFYKHYRKLYRHTLFLPIDVFQKTSKSCTDEKKQNTDTTSTNMDNEFSHTADITGSDKLLFRYPSEWYYGFATSGYVYRILNSCYDLSTIHVDSASTLKTLSGGNFSEVLQKVYSLPNVFSRHFFLKYACTAALQSTSYKCEYLEPSHRPMSMVDKEADLISIPGSLVPHIDSFITLLKELTIPILETCWDIVISELMNKSKNKTQPSKTNCAIFKQYVDEHYDELTFDYTTIPDEKLTQKKDPLISIKNYISNCIRNSIKASINNFSENPNAKPYKKSSYIMEIFEPDFVVIADNRHACHDLMEILIRHFRSSDTDISPEKELLDIQIPNKPILFTPKNDILKDFLNRNFRNIFTYYVRDFDTRTK